MVEEFVEILGGVCKGVGRGAVVDEIALLEEKGAEPTVLAYEIVK